MEDVPVGRAAACACVGNRTRVDQSFAVHLKLCRGVCCPRVVCRRPHVFRPSAKLAGNEPSRARSRGTRALAPRVSRLILTGAVWQSPHPGACNAARSCVFACVANSIAAMRACSPGLAGPAVPTSAMFTAPASAATGTLFSLPRPIQAGSQSRGLGDLRKGSGLSAGRDGGPRSIDRGRPVIPATKRESHAPDIRIPQTTKAPGLWRSANACQ